MVARHLIPWKWQNDDMSREFNECPIGMQLSDSRKELNGRRLQLKRGLKYISQRSNILLCIFTSFSELQSVDHIFISGAYDNEQINVTNEEIEKSKSTLAQTIAVSSTSCRISFHVLKLNIHAVLPNVYWVNLTRSRWNTVSRQSRIDS